MREARYDSRVQDDNNSEYQQPNIMHDHSSKYHLEDYIYEMEARGLGRENSAEVQSHVAMDSESVGGVSGRPQDLYAQLVQKEKDLILAAELGKALLEKNEELSLQNEKIAEDYSRQLELLEQEKHSLRRKLDALESEYEAKVVELQSDVLELQNSLREQQNADRQLERQKKTIIAELTEQNQRLTDQLKESLKKEEQLTAQINALRDQYSLRKSSLNDHVSHLEVLREEVVIVTEKKKELERRLENILQEREGLSSNLDESSDKILMLERQCREQELQLRQTQRELNELRSTNGSLCERIDALSRSHGGHSTSFGANTSLLAEMDLSSSGHGSGAGSSPHSHPSMHDEILECDHDSIECDEPEGSPRQLEENAKLKQEIMEACLNIRALCEAVRLQRRRASNSLSSLTSSTASNTYTEDIHPHNIPKGMLTNLLQDLESLVRGSAWFQSDPTNSCSECGRHPNDVLQLEAELHLTQEAASKLQRTLQEKTDELEKTTKELTSISSQLTIKQVELNAMQEERDTARRDARDTHLAKDEIVRRAWEVRDQAVGRKNAAEIELARTRIDVLQINSQLMEAIQQKIELSQQLEQWQVDMQVLLDEQMKTKLSKQEKLPRLRVSSPQPVPTTSTPTAASREKRKSNRILGFFQR